MTHPRCAVKIKCSRQNGNSWVTQAHTHTHTYTYSCTIINVSMMSSVSAVQRDTELFPWHSTTNVVYTTPRKSMLTTEFWSAAWNSVHHGKSWALLINNHCHWAVVYDCICTIKWKHDVIRKTWRYFTYCNVISKDRATVTGEVFRKFSEIWTCGF